MSHEPIAEKKKVVPKAEAKEEPVVEEVVKVKDIKGKK